MFCIFIVETNIRGDNCNMFCIFTVETNKGDNCNMFVYLHSRFNLFGTDIMEKNKYNVDVLLYCLK